MEMADRPILFSAPMVREMLKDKVEAGDICFPFAEIHENEGGEQ